jgi:hypothetical protein
VLEGVKLWWEAGIMLDGVGGGGIMALRRDCGASCLGLSVGEPCCGGSSISAWGSESWAATTAGTSEQSHVVEGTDLGRVLDWHTAWSTCGSGLGWCGGMQIWEIGELFCLWKAGWDTILCWELLEGE